MGRKTLTDQQKIYVVKRLAAYDSLPAIVRGLAEEFGITVPGKSLRYYDPENRRPTLARRWRELFWKTRKSYIEATADIGASHKPVRLRWRGKLATEAWDAGQYKVANDILDSVAKEADDAAERSQPRGHFGLRGGPLTATVRIVRPSEPAPAGEAADKRVEDERERPDDSSKTGANAEPCDADARRKSR